MMTTFFAVLLVIWLWFTEDWRVAKRHPQFWMATWAAIAVALMAATVVTAVTP